jgi:hypothetical protein
VSIRSLKRAQERRVVRERRRASVLARRGALVAGTALSATTLMAASAQAANFTVTTSGDDASPGTNCTPSGSGAYSCTTLRDAVYSANNSSDSSNTINFDPGLSGSTITLNPNSPLTINGNALVIQGLGQANLAIDGANATEIFDVASSNGNEADSPVSITGLTLENGFSSGSGGAIFKNVDRALNLGSDTIKKSQAADGQGGGVDNLAGPLTIADSTLTGNTAPLGEGGAVYDHASYEYLASITNTTISGDNSAERGGGIYAEGPLAVSGSHITGNTASESGNGGGGGVYIRAKYGATITGTVISGNTADADGGGVVLNTDDAKYSQYDPIVLQDSTVSGNQAPLGAGVSVPYAAGDVRIAGSTLSGNTGTGTSYGGGLFVYSVGGKLSLSNSTISGNSATNGGGVSLGGAYNGRLNYQRSAASAPGTIVLGNSTISGNSASNHGGGIFLGEYTKTYNGPEYSGNAELNSTIVSGNHDQGGQYDLFRPGTSTSGGFNGAFSLVQSPGNAPFVSQRAMIFGKDPQLGALGDNGGPTQTMKQAGTSPVIDQGHAPADLNTDQRGQPRTVDTGIPNASGGDGTDIGAVELPAGEVVLPASGGAGFEVMIRTTLLAPNTRPLLVDDQTPVTCTVKTGSLQTCLIQVRKGNTLLARGQATIPASSRSLRMKTHVTKAGLFNYRHHPLGQNVTVEAIGDPSSPGQRDIFGNAHLLALPKITLPLHKRTATLSAHQKRDYKTVARLLAGAKSVTCTAFSDKGKGDVSLTRSQAKAVCAQLKKDGLKGKTRFVGRGHAKLLFPSANQKARLADRRVVITFSF